MILLKKELILRKVYLDYLQFSLTKIINRKSMIHLSVLSHQFNPKILISNHPEIIDKLHKIKVKIIIRLGKVNIITTMRNNINNRLEGIIVGIIIITTII